MYVIDCQESFSLSKKKRERKKIIIIFADVKRFLNDDFSLNSDDYKMRVIKIKGDSFDIILKMPPILHEGNIKDCQRFVIGKFM